MTKLTDTNDGRNHPRTMAVGTRETLRTNADGTVEVDDDDHAETLKTAGFKEVSETDSGDTLGELTIGELRDKADEAGITDETDMRSKDSIIESLREHGAE